MSLTVIPNQHEVKVEGMAQMADAPEGVVVERAFMPGYLVKTGELQLERAEDIGLDNVIEKAADGAKTQKRVFVAIVIDDAMLEDGENDLGG